MRQAAAALAALAVLALAGCGGGEASGDAGDAAIDLTLTLWPTGAAGDSISWHAPVRADRRRPSGTRRQACAALTAVEDPFGKVPPPKRCKEIPGSSPEVAVLEGDFRGRKVR